MSKPKSKTKTPPSKRRPSSAEFAELALTWQLLANSAPDDKPAFEIVQILLAVGEAYSRDPEWIEEIAGKARYYLKTRNLGPGWRTAESGALAACIERGLARGASSASIAGEFLDRLRAYPETCTASRVPVGTAAYPPADESRDRETVGAVLDRARLHGQKDAENIVKGALRALGHKATKNLFAKSSAG